MKLFIGRLDYKANNKDLENFFAKYKPDAVEIIIDKATGRSKGFGFVNIPDDFLANQAIAECDGKKIKGRSIAVSIAQDRGNTKKQERNHNTKASSNDSVYTDYIFPYNFCKRLSNKKNVESFHSELLNNHYDIAFDITWETKAAIALNPCTIIHDPKTNKKVPARNPETEKDSEYAGYNKRWLMTDGRLVISPFTVKSAIAQGVANLLGGCYRVEPFELKPKDGRFRYHEDTIPKENVLCNDMTAEVCPRCRMFGMTNLSEKDNIEVIGLKGRFKASALISCSAFSEDKDMPIGIPIFKKNSHEVDLKNWMSKEGIVCKQLFLPIQGAPKYHRTDKDGYIDHSGMKGAKYYHHADLTIQKLIKLIEETNRKTEPNKKNDDFEYSHRLRNYAQVCKEGVSFVGTLGADNCSEEEIAALLILLDSRIANHGFKVGLGKAMGMGSIHSTINKVWVRGIDYKWHQTSNINTHESIIDEITKYITNFKNTLNNLIETGKKLHAINTLLERQERTLSYPPIGNQYWRKFKSHLFPKP